VRKNSRFFDSPTPKKKAQIQKKREVSNRLDTSCFSISTKLMRYAGNAFPVLLPKWIDRDVKRYG